MEFRVRLLAAALVLLAAGAQDGRAAEPKTWYVYCEGGSADGHWAVFSENFWPHPETAGYGRLVGSAAKAFFESRHDLSLEGCAGVKFGDDRLAEHSRSLTAQLHRKMGDRIFFLRLPAEILPAAAITPVRASQDGGGATDQMASGQAADAPGWAPATAPR